jgi:formylmethanofuran dehydrogenase subunit E-like metal-binding protein
MKSYFLTMVFFLLTLMGPRFEVNAKEAPIQQLGNQVIAMALKKLDADPNSTDLACLTNAGYVLYKKKSTLPLLDTVSQKTQISLGNKNLLQVHSNSSESLWFAFIKKKSPKELLLTYIEPTPKSIKITDPLNVYVKIGQSFDRFEEVLGLKAFTLVTFANGWADKIPQDLMEGALWHDHLCSGVFSGFFSVNFIRKHLSREKEEKYIYIGAPAWCQDDYIMRVLNLTPGKHGYYTMAYPWSRPWTTAEKSYPQLGGILIRFNSASQTGDASLLRFDWHEEDFKAFIGKPRLELNWKKDRWLHIWYNRFFLRHLNQPEFFVSILKTKKLNSQQDLNCLVDMGANPLEQILGPDPKWVPERKQG